METHGLAGKMIAKMPKIARDCESPASIVAAKGKGE
jgi:hypothetical protein